MRDENWDPNSNETVKVATLAAQLPKTNPNLRNLDTKTQTLTAKPQQPYLVDH